MYGTARVCLLFRRLRVMRVFISGPHLVTQHYHHPHHPRRRCSTSWLQTREHAGESERARTFARRHLSNFKMPHQQFAPLSSVGCCCVSASNTVELTALGWLATLRRSFKQATRPRSSSISLYWPRLLFEPNQFCLRVSRSPIHLQLLYFIVRIIYLNDSLTGWHWVGMQ